MILNFMDKEHYSKEKHFQFLTPTQWMKLRDSNQTEFEFRGKKRKFQCKCTTSGNLLVAKKPLSKES